MIRRVVVAVFLLLAACGGVESEQTTVVLDEFSIETSGPLVGGQRTMVVENIGEFAHTLVVTDPESDVVAATDLIGPGESVEIETSLPPGVLQFSCRIVLELPDGSLSDHFEAGMEEEVKISAVTASG